MNFRRAGTQTLVNCEGRTVSNFDEAAGKVKQGVGGLTDDESMEREGEVQEGVGGIREKAGDVKDEAEERWEDAKDSM